MRMLPDVLMALTLTNDHGRAVVMADAAEVAAGDRVLDIGCGPGLGLLEVAKRGASPIGLDPSPAMLWLAAQRVPRGSAVLLPAAVDAIPLPCDSVNIAWASASFHHWPDVDAGLAEVRRVLAPEGRVLILERATHGHGPIGKHGISGASAEGLAAKLTERGFDGAAIEHVQIAGKQFVLAKAGALVSQQSS